MKFHHLLILLAVAAGLGAMARAPLTPAKTDTVRAGVESSPVAVRRKCFQKCTRVRVCNRVPQRICQSQRYCQPRRTCTQYRVGNRIIQKCQSVCQWLVRRYCRMIYRLRCRLEPRCRTVCIAVRG